jgi:hypothetical protein
MGFLEDDLEKRYDVLPPSVMMIEILARSLMA